MATYAIRCPSCGKEAALDNEPFPYLGRAKDREDLESSSALRGRTIEYGDALHWEKFPDVFPWFAPQNHLRYTCLHPTRREIWGVCQCVHCGCRRRYQLHWPDDAFYQTEVRGQILWAWNRRFAVVLREYIASEVRDPTAYVPFDNEPHRNMSLFGNHYYVFLKRIPAHFLEVKHRKEAVKKLDRLLEQT